MFVYELSGCGFESSCSHLTVRFRTCFEQGVSWHSGNYSELIHSETLTWHDKNIQSLLGFEVILHLMVKYVGPVIFSCFYYACHISKASKFQWKSIIKKWAILPYFDTPRFYKKCLFVETVDNASGTVDNASDKWHWFLYPCVAQRSFETF